MSLERELGKLFLPSRVRPANERDNQRSKVYAAERLALEPLQTPIPTVRDVERYLAKQSKRKTLQERYGTAVDLTRWPIQVKDGRGRSNACAFYDAKSIALPLWARNDRVILHEWAHIIHMRLGLGRAGTRSAELLGGASHGWQFVAIYLDLIRFCMGREAWVAMKAACKQKRVRWKAKRARTMSLEARQALKERMTLARAARKRDE